MRKIWKASFAFLMILLVGISLLFNLGTRWGVSMGFPPNPERSFLRIQAMVDIARELETLKKIGAPMPESDAFYSRIERLPAFQGWSGPSYHEDKERKTVYLYLCLQGWSAINLCYTMGEKDLRWNGWSFTGESLQNESYDRFAP